MEHLVLMTNAILEFVLMACVGYAIIPEFRLTRPQLLMCLLFTITRQQAVMEL